MKCVKPYHGRISANRESCASQTVASAFSQDDIAAIWTQVISYVDGMVAAWSVLFNPLGIQAHMSVDFARRHGLCIEYETV